MDTNTTIATVIAIIAVTVTANIATVLAFFVFVARDKKERDAKEKLVEKEIEQTLKEREEEATSLDPADVEELSPEEEAFLRYNFTTNDKTKE